MRRQHEFAGAVLAKARDFRELALGHSLEPLRAADIGRTAFNQACARCHGIDAVNKGQVGPDLTKMDRACRRILDPAVQRLCVEDNDDFFLKSVQQGKVRVGVVHMPAWQDVLSPAAIWTLRTFLETRRGQ